MPQPAPRLPAMKALLRDLEESKLIFPEDTNVRALKRNLRARIAKAEKKPFRGGRWWVFIAAMYLNSSSTWKRKGRPSAV